MALIKCPECGKEVSDTCEACINCGFYMGSIIPKISKEDDTIYGYIDTIYYILEKNNCMDDGIAKKYKNAKEKMDNVKRRKEKYYWLIHNMPYIKKNFTLEKVSKVSYKAQKDYETLSSYIKCEEKKYNRYWRNTSFLYLMIKENELSDEAINDYINMNDDEWEEKYLDVISMIKPEHLANYIENADVQYSNLKEWILDLENKICNRELFYIIENAFNEIKPTEDKNFGAIDLCQYIDDKYKLDGKFYNAIGFVNNELFSFKHSQLLHGERPSNSMRLSDGRTLDYYFYYYSDKEKEDTSLFPKYLDRDIEKVNNNAVKEIEKCLKFIEKEKIKSHGDGCSDIDFNIQDMKNARKLYLEQCERYEREGNPISTLNGLTHEEINKMSSDILRNNPLRGQNVAKCPTCGSTNVQKISGVGRAASIGLFGLASSKIGKSMQCKNCGYKW